MAVSLSSPTPSVARRRFDLGFARQTWLVGLFALIVRLALGRFEPLPPTRITAYQPHGPLAADETWYVHVAHSLLQGKGFTLGGQQTALHGPLTVLLLVPATLLEPHGYTLQRATMSLLGALSVVVLGFVARELAGPRAGLIAAVIAALYPGLWVNDLIATSETPAILLLCLVALLSLRARRAASPLWFVLAGAGIGLLALDRAELAVLGLALLAACALPGAKARGELRRVALWLLAAVVVAVAFVTPWTIYNEARFHRTVLISNDLGQTLVGANCPQSYYGPLTGYDGNTCFYPVLKRAEVALAHQPYNEAAYDSYFRHAAVSYALHHVSRWPVVAAMRELWLWSLWRPGWTVFMATVYIGRPAWMTWAQIWGFWLLAPVAILGLFAARRRRVEVRVPAIMIAFTAAIGLLVVGHLRYRIPAEVAVVLLAAVAIDSLIARRAGVSDDPQSASATSGAGWAAAERPTG